MKTIIHSILLCFLCSGLAFSQPAHVEISFNKTSTLIFPSIIQSVDRGSRDVLAQKANGTDNILQLKAARPDFPETNLTVITGDGDIHQFVIDYTPEPGHLVMLVQDGPQRRAASGHVLFKTAMTETQLQTLSSRILNLKRRIRGANERQGHVTLSLRGIYIRNNILFCHFGIDNTSNITYDIDFHRFYIEDVQRAKRTASQEVDVPPVFVFGNDHAVPGKSHHDIVYAFQKFTIPDAKRFVIEIFEHNGGRNLRMPINNRTIVRARRIPEP